MCYCTGIDLVEGLLRFIETRDPALPMQSTLLLMLSDHLAPLHRLMKRMGTGLLGKQAHAVVWLLAI